MCRKKTRIKHTSPYTPKFLQSIRNGVDRIKPIQG